MIAGFADDAQLEFVLLCGTALAGFFLVHQFFFF